MAHASYPSFLPVRSKKGVPK